MDAILGAFLFFGGWILLFLGVFIVVAVGAFYLTKKYGLVLRLIFGLTMIAICYSAFFWDAHLGKWYTDKLCKENVLFKVYETVELPRSYWDESGWPKFHKKPERDFIPSVLGNKYEKKIGFSEVKSIFKIYKHEHYIRKITSGDLLVFSSSYTFKGGWAKNRLIPFTETDQGYTCGREKTVPNIIPGSQLNHLLTSWVFLPETPLTKNKELE